MCIKEHHDTVFNTSRIKMVGTVISKLRKTLLRTYFPDYMKRSTIHGVAYISQPDRPLIERVLWLVTIVLSIGCGSFYIASTYAKWQSSPVIVTLDDRPTYVQEVCLQQ